MRYSHNRNYRDSIFEEVNKLIEKIDDDKPKIDNWFIRLIKIVLSKIKHYMSYLKLK